MFTSLKEPADLPSFSLSIPGNYPKVDEPTLKHCANLQEYIEKNLPLEVRQTSYRLIRAFSRYCYYLLVRRNNEVRKHLLELDPTKGHYTLISKKSALSGTYQEIIAQLVGVVTQP